jgi:opacity protein-like surface antigen
MLSSTKENKMKNTIAALAAVFAATSAMATDLPSRSTPTAPSPVFASKSFYAGVNGGGIVTDGINVNAPWTVGVVAGYNVAKIGPIVVSAEGTYDYSKDKTNDIAGNIVGGYSFGSITPYALAGVGYRFADIKNEALWNVGVGVKVSVTSSFDVDARYRRVDNYDHAIGEDRVTLGVNYKF